MEYKQSTIKLKDDRVSILRAPSIDDAAEMVTYLKKLCGESNYLASYPEELTYTEDNQSAYIQANIESEASMMILCTVNGIIAGNSQILLKKSIKTRHRASIMIGLLKEYWNLGIGTVMLQEMERIAKEYGVEQLELEMIEGNERALGLYKKVGFTVVGEIPDAYRLKDGTSLAAVLMRKVLI